MWTGLVLQLRGPPLDEHLQQIERPLVDRGLGPAADLGDLLDDRIDGRLVADPCDERVPRSCAVRTAGCCAVSRRRAVGPSVPSAVRASGKCTIGTSGPRNDGAHALQERIDLAGRVSDHGLGHGGQQAEVVRGLVGVPELPQVILRDLGLFQQGDAGQRHLRVQFPRRRRVAGAAPLPGCQLLRDPVVQAILLRRP